MKSSNDVFPFRQRLEMFECSLIHYVRFHLLRLIIQAFTFYFSTRRQALLVIYLAR